MNILYLILFNTIILLFPIVINLFYYSYNTNLEKEYSKTFFDFSLLSSIYLVLIFNRNSPNYDVLILINIPLLLAFIKKRSFISFILSIIIIYISNKIGFNIYFIILEYLFFYFINFYFKKIDIVSIVCIIKLISAILFFDLSRLFIVLIFIIVTYLILSMYKKGEDIIKLQSSFKDMQKEKQVRTSLFKITHEIKNPIAVCKSYLDMFDINNKSHIKYIDIIKEEINQILLLLQDFLAMNKIKINKEILDINYLLEDIVEQFKMILKEKNILFEYEIEDDEIFILGDYNRLNQVLINIIKNSIEALDGNNKRIKLYTYIDNKFNIVVWDNGPGILKEDLGKIKEPFYTTKKNGTGLGVSLSYEIIKGHGGNILYESNNGCKVTISLPLDNNFN